MRQTKDITVNVYTNTIVEEHHFQYRLAAMTFARKQFRRPEVYKVKVWAKNTIPGVGLLFNQQLILQLI